MTTIDVILLLEVLCVAVVLWMARQARIVCEEVRAKRLALEEKDRRNCLRRAVGGGDGASDGDAERALVRMPL